MFVFRIASFTVPGSTSAEYKLFPPLTLSSPKALVELACGSQSISNTLFSIRAKEADKFTDVVVLPTPPFWFAIAIILATIHSFFFLLTILWKNMQVMFHVKHEKKGVFNY